MIIDFVAGGLGAAASVVVGQPLDTVKVRRGDFCSFSCCEIMKQYLECCGHASK